jgi:signal peptidase II
VIFILLLLIIVRKERKERFLVKLSYGLILGGASSNLLDRIVYGYVIDYIDLRIWPVFNLSDAGISVGVLIILLVSLGFIKTFKKAY